MKFAVLLICLELFGCSSFQTEKSSITEPAILKQQPLPYIPESIFKPGFELFTEILLNEDGSVENAKLLRGSGDKSWDSLAEISLLKWKFSPATLNGIPIKILMRRRIKVELAQPENLLLAEILFENMKEADSAYYALENGADFYKLVMQYSISLSKKNKGILGQVNIQTYPDNIENNLSRLDEEEFTKPLPYGRNYIIFKRIKSLPTGPWLRPEASRQAYRSIILYSLNNLPGIFRKKLY